MDTEARIQHPTATEPVAGRPARIMSEGASVVLLRPRRLRGTIGTARRQVTGGWEIEIRSPLGTPMHLTVPVQALHLR